VEGQEEAVCAGPSPAFKRPTRQRHCARNRSRTPTRRQVDSLHATPHEERDGAETNLAEILASHLQRQWAVGCHEGPRLLTEIRAIGYRGCYSSIAKFLARWRDHEPELKPKSRPPTSVGPRQQAECILRSPGRSRHWSPQRC
jgi:hypothetical protein